jgi:hypothetical protein
MKGYSRYLLLLFISLFLGINSYSQDSLTIEREKMLVLKNDGSKYTGYILSDDAREILLESDQVGKLYIPKHFIKLIEVYDSLKVETANSPEPTTTSEDSSKTIHYIPEEEAIEIELSDSSLFQNFISTKNLLSDNALPLRLGESFIKFVPLGFEIGIPLTKNWSLGAFSSYWGLPVGLKTKYSFKFTEKSFLSVDLGYGSMAFGSWADFGVDDGGGVISSTLSFGDRIKNFSIKAGYGLMHETFSVWLFNENTQEWTETGIVTNYTHIFFSNFGAMIQLNDRATLVFDFLGVYLDGGINVGAGAAMRFGRKPRSKWQLGGTLMFFDGAILPIPIPNLSYTYVFSRRNQK